MGTELMEGDPPPAEALSSATGHEGFVAAFEELYDCAYQHAYKLLGDRHEAEDRTITIQRYFAVQAPGPAIDVSDGLAGFVVVNENLANLIPAVPIVIGAGGVSVDFDGRSIADRMLRDGRCSVLHAANAPLRDTLLHGIARARAQVGPSAGDGRS